VIGEAVTFELDGAHHLRATPRYKIFKPTEIMLRGVAARAHILNLSAGGALVFASDPPSPGEILSLRCGNHALSAQVAWKNENRVGVVFLSPLTETHVREFIAAQDAAVAAASFRTSL
jgi:hypothetical protein